MPRKIRIVLICLPSIPAVALGAFFAHLQGISWGAFLPNVLGAKGRRLLNRNLIAVSVTALLLMTVSLFSSGIEEVHRWIRLGPLQFNISMLLAPTLLYCIGKCLGSKNPTAVMLVLGSMLVHVFQPDAGQATAFGLAAFLLFLLNISVPWTIRFAGCTVAIVGIAVTWLQLDPLPPVVQVERILHLIAGYGIGAIILMSLAITLLFVPVLWTTLQNHKAKKEEFALTVALIIYLVAEFAVTEAGNFPVPVIGAGASSVIGWYSIVGLTAMGSIFES